MELYGEGGAMSKYASFSLLLAELMIGTVDSISSSCAISRFQSPISGVNDWNFSYARSVEQNETAFQSPISGVNDWNDFFGVTETTVNNVSVSY